MLAHAWLSSLRALNMLSMLLRLFLALILGGLIGMERERKHLPAGFRTYMLVCLGAALTMILSQSLTVMQEGPWAEAVLLTGNRTDVSRFGAQVISGIGFLGAGTILVTRRQEVKGLTTAAGLWTSACMGLATGAGLYECTVVGFVLILMCAFVFPFIEHLVRVKARNMVLYVEFNTVENVTSIIQSIKAMGIHIYDMDIDRGKLASGIYQPNAVLTIKLPPRMGQTQVLAQLSRMESVHMIRSM